ncbi:sensor domain-containing diguanylate cyclase [Arenimonas caeni]|uniref:GGDEF domain-containing protein n=1 Tax=Arenimonas caeni TaxID=2058085 RepID=A0A2P6MBT1_9GAMM|nr:sensor domain-containing diguanylate cyclase [Arenimonas caeni]PRH83429.1 GGDEF domain-containing protein [Arenimonas caeni]
MVSSDRLREVIATQAQIARLGFDLGGVMDLVAARTLPLVRADGAVVELVEGDEMVYRGAAGTAARSLGTRIGRRGSLSGLCMEQGVVLRCDDSEADPRVDLEACRRVGLRSMVVLPLMHEGEPVGVLKAMSSRPAGFDDTDAEVLGLLGDAVGAAMFHATRHVASDLFHLATHDPLTDLPNRALFADRLKAAIGSAHRLDIAVGVMMVDVDDLKPVNDEFGHAAGDALLQEFARRLSGCARGSDTVARLGGDEFAAVLVPLRHGDSIHGAIARFQTALALPFGFRGRDFPLRASFGGAVALAESGDPHDLLELADQRMYDAKRARKQSTT